MMEPYLDEPNYRPIIQHAMLIQVAEFFKETRPYIFLQDPGYRDHDKATIESLWLEARFVEDPQGFLEVDDDTLVISIDPDVPVRSIVADIATPAAMIWAGKPVWAYMDPSERVRARDPASPRLDYLMTHLYAAVPYPCCPYTNTLSNTGWKASVLCQIICFRAIDHLKDDHTQDKAMKELGLEHLLLKARSTVGTTPAAGNGTTPAAGNGTTSAAATMSWVLNGTTSAVGKGTTSAVGKGTTSAVDKGTTSAMGKRKTSAPDKGTTSAVDRGTTSAPDKGTTSAPAWGTTRAAD